ncbi:MAG: type II toxin-antitoxin system HicB family antitoxin [Acidobacteria bacterium]|nr:type II toxin-antitoxin system HicB family antitoxin [Acidobacteriota bacterium]
MLEHKGYRGYVEFDDEAALFHGEVLDTRDVITFQGRSVAEIHEAFKDSIDDYLDFCAERGEKPDKAFSGRLMVRLPPRLHRDLYVQAKRQGKSLNQLIAEKLERAS